MNRYEHFNGFNCAPSGVRQMIVRGDNGKVGRVGVPVSMQTPTEPKRYSFLALSDAHITPALGDDAERDFNRAMQYANNNDVAFSCICGDTVDYGTVDAFKRFLALRTAEGNKPVYAITGNHDIHISPNDVSDVVVPLLPTYFGHDLYYSFEHNDDVFIMLGEYGWATNALFADGELDFLQAELEKHRNKRCFVFFHVFSGLEDDSGVPSDAFYPGGALFEASSANEAQREQFLRLLRHYKNTVWFHGHSHAEFDSQTINRLTNVSTACGYRSIHIPSLAKPKVANASGKGETDESRSQGYAVDVYEDCIVLRGCDFAEGKFLPMATYRIDTTCVPMEADSFEGGVSDEL